MGTSCAVSVVGAGAAGYGLDSWLSTTPWLTFGGLAFGIISAVMLCVVQVRKFS
jgi:F0F1-type ATP synthase assembly protein I